MGFQREILFQRVKSRQRERRCRGLVCAGRARREGTYLLEKSIEVDSPLTHRYSGEISGKVLTVRAR